MRSERFCRSTKLVDVLIGVARYYLTAYSYYGGRGVPALRFLYKVRY